MHGTDRRSGPWWEPKKSHADEPRGSGHRAEGNEYAGAKASLRRRELQDRGPEQASPSLKAERAKLWEDWKMKPIEAPGIEALPVLDTRGFAVMFDLWVAGRWVGSRRTVEQCEQWLSHYCGTPIEATEGSAW